MRTLFVVLSVLLISGCEKKKESTEPVAAPTAPADPHGGGLPFDPGEKPKIEDVAVDDLGKFLGGTQWCRQDVSGELKYAFTVDGKWTQTRGDVEEKGTWRVQSGRVVLEGADGGTRNLDVQAGKVNGKPVVAFDGRLFGACE